MRPTPLLLHPRRSGTAGTVIVLAALLALSGCGGAESGGASTAAEPAAADQRAAGPAAAGGGGGFAAGDTDAETSNGSAAASGAGSAPAGAGPAATGQLADTAARGRRIRTAEVTLTVTALDTAAAKVRALADGAGGFVSSETTAISQPTSAKGGEGDDAVEVQSGESVIVLRIPEPELDGVLGKVGGIGTVVSRSQRDQDVTGEIADTSSRIETQRESVARTRELLRQAKSMQDIVFIEGQLTQRQADLEALQARLKSLSDRADLSTLTLTLQVPDSPAARQPTDRNSFLAGLDAGWEALVASTNVLLTVLGAVLPVAVVALVVGYPASVLLRRRSQRRPAASGGAASSSYPAGGTGEADPGTPPAGPATN